MNLGDRCLIIGKSGSGKTTLAQHILLDAVKRNPHAGVLIINHKCEESINKLMKPLSKIPKTLSAGDRINIAPLMADKDDDEAVDNLLKQVYLLGDFIVYVDEGLMINPRNKWMLALQTQGRSKRISVITLSQRPAFISRFAITQASEIHVYNIIGKDDQDTLAKNISTDKSLFSMLNQLARYEYITYRESEEALSVQKPVKYPVKGKIESRRSKKKLLGIVAAVLLAVLSVPFFKTNQKEI